MEFQIKHVEVYGLNKAFIASGNPMRTELSNNIQKYEFVDFSRAKALAGSPSGHGHDNFLQGILVQMDIYAPLYWWKQAQRYHWFDFISSQSTMHRLLQFNVRENCVPEVDEIVLSRIEFLINDFKEHSNKYSKREFEEKWRVLIASLPSGFILGATMTTNYRQLKTMYIQRKNHKMKEWRDFCTWCEELPYFTDLLGKEIKK